MVLLTAISKSNIHLPSGVYSVLYDEDILNSYNDINMRWIALDNWTYTRTFKGKFLVNIQFSSPHCILVSTTSPDI